jgi:acyl-[acyl-carrier-protein] desaturase
MDTMKTRLEVMAEAEPLAGELLSKYLLNIDTMWQPSDLLPDSRDDDFLEQVKEIKEVSRELNYDLMVTLIGDLITEEALPTYESWIMNVDGIDQINKNNWSKWLRGWTSEENRHGDLLNKYIYMSGRVNMREIEITTQHLINDGFDPGMMADPYKNFIYTSFQELATNVSHRRTGTLAKKSGCVRLAKICGIIASDELRHANAYMDFVDKFFELDPNETMLAFEYMMKIHIVMPAHLMRESGAKPKGELFRHFSNAAQRCGVYTTFDYIDIMEQLIQKWDITNLRELKDDGERARDYIMQLPQRMKRIASRIVIPSNPYAFKWIS